MNVHEIRAAAVSHLRGRGIEVSDRAPLKTLANIIEANGGPSRNYSVSPGDYIESYLTPAKPTGSQFNLMTRKSIKLKHHRAADILAAQPPMMTPRGIGNNKQPGGFMPQVWR